MVALIRFELRKLLVEKRSLIGLLNIVLINVLFALAFTLRNSHPNHPHELHSKVMVGELMNAYMYVQTILAPSVFMLFPMVLAVMGAYILAGELELGNLRMVLFRPVARWQVLGAKFVALSCYSLVMLVSLAVISFGTSALMFQTRGTVLVVGPMYLLGGGTWLLPAGEALSRILLSYVLALPMLMSVAAMSLMLALVTRHFTSAAILTSTVYFASYIIGTIPILSAIHPYLPTRYWPFWKFALLPDIPWPQVGQYGLWTMGYTVVFLALGAALFNLRDV